MQRQFTTYGVAFRDGVDLFLFLRLRRNPKGEVFVIFPREDLNAHASYHADGTHHVKSSRDKWIIRERSKPATIMEPVNMLTTSVGAGDPRAINRVCRVEQFTEVFELPVSDLINSGRWGISLSVDIVPAGGHATLAASARVIRQKKWRDAVPWFIVTLFEFDYGNTPSTL